MKKAFENSVESAVKAISDGAAEARRAASPLDPWQTAALLKDRTRRAIRERRQAGDTVADLAQDYGVPEAFIARLCAWQLFGDDPVGIQLQPPQHVIDLAVEVSGWSPCRSKRGVVIFKGADIHGNGYNYKPRGFDCDGSEACKSTCRTEAIHAEQQALLSLGTRASGADLLHVKTVGGCIVPSGGPSCVECSKLILVAGIVGVWLYHEDGWRRYDPAEFHELSLREGRAAPPPLDFDFLDAVKARFRAASQRAAKTWPQEVATDTGIISSLKDIPMLVVEIERLRSALAGGSRHHEEPK